MALRIEARPVASATPTSAPATVAQRDRVRSRIHSPAPAQTSLQHPPTPTEASSQNPNQETVPAHRHQHRKRPHQNSNQHVQQNNVHQDSSAPGDVPRPTGNHPIDAEHSRSGQQPPRRPTARKRHDRQGIQQQENRQEKLHKALKDLASKDTVWA